MEPFMSSNYGLELILTFYIHTMINIESYWALIISNTAPLNQVE